jgi:hypothetical protein
MFTAFLAFIQAIPAITGGFNNFVSKYYDAKVQITAARIGGDVNVARALVSGVVAEGQTRVEFLKTVSQSKFLMCITGGFAGPWIVYEWKVVVWDNIVCPYAFGRACFTPTITGLVADWSGVILAGIFGTASVTALGQMFFNRKER